MQCQKLNSTSLKKLNSVLPHIPEHVALVRWGANNAAMHVIITAVHCRKACIPEKHR